MTSTDPDPHTTQRDIAARLAKIGFALPGTITERMMRCGKQRCHCADDPTQRHGPYLQWTRTVNGKTVTKMLTPDQLARYQTWFDNHHQLHDLTTKLETISIQAITDAERWAT